MKGLSSKFSLDKRLANACQYLLDNSEHREDGSLFWPYQPKQIASTEATAWCTLALAERNPDLRSPIAYFFLNSQNTDGGWSTAPQAGTSDWSSALAILALRLLLRKGLDEGLEKRVKKSIRQGFQYLLENRMELYPPAGRLILLLLHGPNGLAYGRGWPWTAHCYNWVEPTSYSLLALKIYGLPSIDTYKMAVEHAHKFLLEHACQEGGWNHGANFCLGTYAPPYSVTTAEALLALQDLKKHPTVQDGLKYLKNLNHLQVSPMSLAWNILALLAFDENPVPSLEMLLPMQESDGGFAPNLMVSALATTALSAYAHNHPLLIR